VIGLTNRYNIEQPVGNTKLIFNQNVWRGETLLPEINFILSWTDWSFSRQITVSAGDKSKIRSKA